MNHLVLDDFFPNPEDIREMALKSTYFTKETHPGDIAQFPGHRTDYFNVSHPEFYNYMVMRQLECVKKLVDMSEFKEYWTKFSFSWTDESIPKVEHQDFTEGWNGFKRFFGGVLYLTPNPPKNTGTILTNVETIENKFNRYVMYDATCLHAIENSFGKTVEDARLVLTHFIYLK